MKIDKGGAQDDKDKLRCAPAIKEDASDQGDPVAVLLRAEVIKEKENRQKQD
jgi:hypothetical protein